MSHGDQLSQLPTGFRVIASTPSSPFTAIDHELKQIYAIQFHPEVTHTPRGNLLLGNFVHHICKVKANWSMVSGLSFS